MSTITVAIGISLLLTVIIYIYNYLSGKKLIRDLLHYQTIKKYSLAYWDEFAVSSANKSDIIISLSSIPSRLSQIEPTIKSLLYQSQPAKEIHLYLPEFSERERCKYEVPEFLLTLQSIKILTADRDWGPATKFIPAVASLPPNQKILVVDDDNIYPHSFVQSFHNESLKKDKWILAASGWRVPIDLIDRPTTLWSNIHKIPPTPLPCTRVKSYYEVDIVQGYSGFLCKPHFFHYEKLTDYSQAPEAAWLVDDVWVSAHSTVPKYVFPARRFCYTLFWKKKFFKSTSLAAINNHGKKDYADRHNSIMINFFKQKWLIFKN